MTWSGNDIDHTTLSWNFVSYDIFVWFCQPFFNQIIDLWHYFEWLWCQISLLTNPNPGELSVLLQSKNTAVIPECQVLSWKWFAGSVNRNISNTHTQLLTWIISRVRYSQFIDNCWHWILQTICGLNLYKWTIILKTFSSQLSKPPWKRVWMLKKKFSGQKSVSARTGSVVFFNLGWILARKFGYQVWTGSEKKF